jgi:hypothetical protein
MGLLWVIGSCANLGSPSRDPVGLKVFPKLNSLSKKELVETASMKYRSSTSKIVSKAC